MALKPVAYAASEMRAPPRRAGLDEVCAIASFAPQSGVSGASSAAFDELTAKV